MSTYVMSDIHGEYDKFIRMLEKINFTDNDKLYIIGDLFDRGSNPLGVLDYVISKPNIELILGNHEKMFLDFQDTGENLWFYNGGQTTYYQMCEKGEYGIQALYNYIKKLDYIKVVGNYILVHGGLYFPENYKELTLDELLELQDKEDCIWDRSNIGNEKPLESYVVISGHTPVQNIEEMEDPHILYRNGNIYIDCGACFRGGKLACLRLEDMKEFYI